MLAIATILFCACQLTLTAADEPPSELDGYWEGFVGRQGAKLGMKVEFKTTTGGVKAVIDIPELHIYGYKLANLRYEPPGLHFELAVNRERDKFDGVLKGEFIEGTYSGRGSSRSRMARFDDQLSQKAYTVIVTDG